MDEQSTIGVLHRQIDQLRRERDALAWARDAWQALAAASLDAVLLIAPDGSIRKANRIACELFQMTEAELIAGGLGAISDVQDERLKRILGQGGLAGQFIGEIGCRRKDGSRFTGKVSASVCTDDRGQSWPLMVIRNIDAPGLSPLAHQDVSDKYKTLFNAFPLGITVADANGNIVETNQAAEDLLGVSKNDHERRALDGGEWRIIRPDGSDMPPGEWASVIALKERRRVDNCPMGIVKPDAAVTWLNVTAAPLPGDRKGVIVTYNDISQTKRALESLRQSEARFRQFFENAGAYCYLVSREGRILEANSAALEALDYPREVLIGQPVSTLYAEESLDHARMLFEKWRQTGTVRNAELVIKTRTGERRKVILNADAMRDDTGVIRHSISIHVDITDLKRLEERFQTVYNHAPIGIVLVNLANQRVMQANPRFGEMLGFAPAELAGRTIADITHPDDKAQDGQLLSASLGGRLDHFQREKRYLRKDGSYCWARLYAQVLPSMAGQPNPVAIAMIADITEQKRAEEELLLHHDIVSTTQDFISLVDRNYIYRIVNDAYLKLTGKPREAIIGRSVAENVGQEVFDTIVKPEIDRCLGGEIVRYQSWFDYAQAGRRCMDITYIPHVKNGVVVGTIVNGRDLTAIKRVEESLLHSQAELRERNQILFAILEHTHIMAVYLDPSFKFIWVNQAYAQSCGFPKESFKGKNHFDLYPNAENQAIFQRVVDTGTPFFVEAKAFEFPDQPDRGLTYWDWSLIPVKGDEGQIGGLVFTLVDVTQRIRSERALRESEEKLRQAQKMEAVGTLSGGIAHEFNNILSIMLGNAELAVEDLPATHPLHRLMVDIYEAGLRGKKVVQQLLTFSRPTPQRLQPLKIATVVGDVMDFLRFSIPAHIHIQTDISTDDDGVRGDANQIHQVIVNLCINAVQAMQDRGGPLLVKLSDRFAIDGLQSFNTTLPAGDYVCLEVIDRGEGIPSENLERIFDPFFTTKPVGKGSGLGLSVVLGIMQSHGGGIQVQQRPGGGTMVQCFFPASPVVETPADSPRVVSAGGTQCIVFLDDEPAIVKMARLRLTRLGYHVETFTDPLAAIAWVEQYPHRADVLITDLSMPNLTGDRVIECIRRLNPRIRTILSTGYMDKMDPDQARKAGADAVLIKPFDRDQLAAVIRAVVNGHH